MKQTIFTLAAMNLVMAATTAQSATIANWKEFNAGSTNSGMNTDSPTIGDGTADDALGAWIGGRFGSVATPESVTLAVGETLTVSGSVVLTGGTTAANNLRFSVHDGAAAFAADSTTWANGGWLLRGGNQSTDGWYQARTNGAFVSTNPDAAFLTSPTNSASGTFDGDSTAAFDWSISVTRDSLTTVDLFGTITGGDGSYDASYTINDETTSLFTYNTVGVLLGNSLAPDQAVFSGVEYNVVPEPSSTALLGLGGLALIIRRRR